MRGFGSLSMEFRFKWRVAAVRGESAVRDQHSFGVGGNWSVATTGSGFQADRGGDAVGGNWQAREDIDETLEVPLQL
ncbi:hypothetical protein ACLB2K_035371 [Fragaria x ananassa]